MKKITFLVFSCLCCQISFAQDKLGFEFGVMKSYFGHIANDAQTGHLSDPCLTFGFQYLHKVAGHFHAGAKVSLQQYSFNYDFNDNRGGYAYGENISHKSVYLAIAPTADVGVGYKQHTHFYISFAPSLLLTGMQNVHEYEFDPTNNINFDSSYGGSKNVGSFLFHTYLGCEQYIHINRSWHIIIDAAFSIIGSNVTSLTYIGDQQVHIGNVYFQLGLLHSFHRIVYDTEGK